MSSPTAPPSVGRRHRPPGTRPRRRWRRILAVVATVLVLLLGGALFGAAWYFSGVVLQVRYEPPPEVAVAAVVRGAAGGDTIEVARTPETEQSGLAGLRHRDGWGVMSGQLTSTTGTVTRAWRDVQGTLSQNATAGSVDSDVYLDDPGSVGLGHDVVTLNSDIGRFPCWFVPAGEGVDASQGADPAETWIVFAHGRGGSREESLRYLPLWHDLGYPVLVPSYRNDPEAPADPRGWYGLGETEWRDIDAAVGYALDNGARHVVLAGWSMGGSIVMQVLDRSEHAEAVAGVVLDAPVLDWRDTLGYQGSTYDLPAAVTWGAVALVEARADIDFDDYDWVARAADVPDVPIYLVHSGGDSFVPNRPSAAFAAARPDIVTFDDTIDADHTREWNVDPQRYEAAMREWFEAEIS